MNPFGHDFKPELTPEMQAVLDGFAELIKDRAFRVSLDGLSETLMEAVVVFFEQHGERIRAVWPGCHEHHIVSAVVGWVLGMPAGLVPEDQRAAVGFQHTAIAAFTTAWSAQNAAACVAAGVGRPVVVDDAPLRTDPIQQFQQGIRHTCGWQKCTSMAVYVPVLEFRPWPGSVSAPAMLSLGICPTCREHITVDDLLTDDGFAQIVSGFASIGRAIPKRELTTLRWDEIKVARA